MANAISIKPRQNLWILGPGRDLGLFIFPQLLIIPLVLALKNWVSLDNLSIWVLGIGGFGHHLPGFIRAYSDPELFRQFRSRFIIAPIFLTLFCGLFAYLKLDAVDFALVAWGTWHGAMQVNGFFRIYDAKVKSFAKATSTLDWLMCLAWFGLGVWHSPVKSFTFFSHFYISGGPLIPSAGYVGFQHLWEIGTGLITLAFLVNAAWQWKNGCPPSPIKLLSMAVAFSFWWYCMVSLNNLILGIVMFEFFHDIQYNTIVWMFQHQRVANGFSSSKVERFLFQRGTWRILFYLAIIAAYGYIGVVTSYVDFNLPEKMTTGESASKWMLRVLAVSAFLHFYYDGFIWRMRNSNTRKGLGLEDASKNPVLEFRPTSGLRHALLWCLFVIPLTALGVSQYMGRGPDAKAMYLNITENIPGSWLAHFFTATYFKIDGKRGMAIYHYQKAIENKPEFPMNHMLLADLLFNDGRIEESKEQYRQTVDLEPDNLEARNNLGYLYLRTGQPLQAEDQFRSALAEDSLGPDLVFGMASSLMKQNKFPEAERYLEQSLKLNPNHAEALNLMGQLRENQGKHTEALSLFQRAVDADSGSVPAKANLKAAENKH